MPDRNPAVSVLMSVYNGERFLRESIGSVLRQTFEDLELIVVDDGSSDRSLEVARSFADPRVRVLANAENRGLAKSLNRGLQEARGTFIARLDADDVCERARIERQVERMTAHPELALMGTWYREIDVDGKVLGRYDLPCNDLWLRWTMLFYCPFVHSAVMMRRSIVPERTGAYDETLRYSMDFELWSRVAERFPVANLGESLVRLRVHRQSMTETYGTSTAEGAGLRFARVARMLDWPYAGDHDDQYVSRYRAMVNLHGGDRMDLDRASIERAAEDLLQLQLAFADEAGLSRSQRRAHRAAIHDKLARRLADAARRRRSSHVIDMLGMATASLRQKLLGVWTQRGRAPKGAEYLPYESLSLSPSGGSREPLK